MNDVKILPRLLRNLAGYKTTHGATSSEAGMLNTAADEIDALRQQVAKLEAVKIEYEVRMKEMRKEQVKELALRDLEIVKLREALDAYIKEIV
jgi:hypothetical protein